MSVCTFKLKSVYLNDLNEVTVVLPDPPMRTEETPEQFYRSGKKYKCLWILHGGRDTYRDWAVYSNIPRLAAAYEIAIVMPNGHDSDFADHPEIGDGFLFEKYFIEELMPMVWNWLPVSSAREDNYLAGNSMGCGAAWRYAVKYAHLFESVAPLCNQPVDYDYLEIYQEMSSADFCAYAKQHAVPAAYGSVGECLHQKELNMIRRYATVRDFLESDENVMRFVKQAIVEGTLPDMWIPCGMDARDQALLEFRAYCKAHSAEQLHFTLYEGETHSFSFWERAVAEYLKYLQIPEVTYFIGR